ncbi:MAG: DEAD/DEAH box helicase family protein [Bacteroidota bacterium]|nr:DEAD/DEAH box helicase family protein [Bacteroidota bacterium]
MKQLYQELALKVSDWRKANYNSEYSTIAEILEWASNPDGSGFKLRPPQIRALETYWYLRLIEDTPHILDLYKILFPNKSDLLKALGIPSTAFEKVDFDLNALLNKIKSDDDFVREFRLHALRETLNLDYSSYILALTMGSGKTALIGAIIATEFGMAFDYPQGPFVQNALVFAPGKTIIESLRELAALPYDRILPQRLYKQFAASVKITFTRDGDPDIPIIEKSIFNVVVTNTEKIRIQKETIRKSDIGGFFVSAQKEDEARTEVANRRLRKLASLPHLAVFSDEAHHTYGQTLDTELKKVRKTVDYLHHQSPNLICVVNTTGTPYYKKQLLRDVVVWYGLSEGIQQGILKDISGNIHAFDFKDNVKAYVAKVIEDFFKEYGNVTLPDGTPAKLAMYFPQTDDVEELRPFIEAKLLELNLSTTLILEHHTKKEDKANFDRFRLKDSQHRIALLVDRGVEGWDVPALFSCALARRLTSSSFVLQAACRCLRQVPGNSKKASIFLSMDNRSILDNALRETYGVSLDDINRTNSKSKNDYIKIIKHNIPKLVVRQIIKTVVKKDAGNIQFQFVRPTLSETETFTEVRYTVAEQQSTYSVLQQVDEATVIETTPSMVDVYTAAIDISQNYYIDFWRVYDELKRIYPEDEIPLLHIADLRKQIENQTSTYEVKEETIEKALALVKLGGFMKELDADGSDVYTAEISYPVDRGKLIQPLKDWQDRVNGFGFHYDPYNFDSNPELNFFERMLAQIRLMPEEIEDIYFTGALTDPRKTDFYVEYKGEDGNWHRYTPDFIIRNKNGKCLIVEIKDARWENTTEQDLQREKNGQEPITIEGRKAIALTKYEKLNPDRLKYHILYTKTDVIADDQLSKSLEFIKEKERG